MLSGYLLMHWCALDKLTSLSYWSQESLDKERRTEMSINHYGCLHNQWKKVGSIVFTQSLYLITACLTHSVQCTDDHSPITGVESGTKLNDCV